MCIPAEPELEAPSWVPDWRATSKSPSKATPPYGSGFQAAALSKAVIRYEDPDILEVTGAKRGTVHKVIEPLHGDAGDAIKRILELTPVDSRNMIYPTGESRLDAWPRTMCHDLLKQRYPEWIAPTLSDWNDQFLNILASPEPLDILHHPIMSAQTYEHTVEAINHTAFLQTDGGHFGFGPTGTQPGDHICILLGCWAPIVLRAVSPDLFKVQGSCYYHGLMDGEAFLGSLPEGWTVLQYSINGMYLPRYLNGLTGEVHVNDPRLGPLPPDWVHVDVERTATDPLFVDSFKKVATGETVDSDPRILLDALDRRGVKLERFRLI